MASSVQGYVRVLNLKESEDDRQALNNLGEAPIADDIALFVNNTRNESVLNIRTDEYDSNTGTITLDNQTLEELNTRSSVFTDRDRVSLRDITNNVIKTDLFVKDSNTFDSFALTENADLTGLFTFTPTGDFKVVRSDEVTLANLINLGVERTGVVSNNDEAFDDGSNDEEGSRLDDVDNFNDELQEIFLTLDTSVFLSDAKYVATENKLTDQKLRTEGNVIIADPGNTIIFEGITDTSPGLYLSDPTSDVDDIQTVRAFSSNSDPWTDDLPETLSTQSTDVTAGNLTLPQGIKINNIAEKTETGNVDTGSFTHKILVSVNGVDYYLCLGRNLGS